MLILDSGDIDIDSLCDDIESAESAVLLAMSDKCEYQSSETHKAMTAAGRWKL